MRIFFDQSTFVPKGCYIYIESVYQDNNKINLSGFLVSKNDKYITIKINKKLFCHKIDECYYNYYYKICESKKTKIIKEIKNNLSNEISVKINIDNLTTENILNETQLILNKFNLSNEITENILSEHIKTKL